MSAPAQGTPNTTVDTAATALEGSPRRAPQRLVVLCDGTWLKRRSVRSVITDGGVQTSSAAKSKWFSNVSLLCQCILPRGASQDDGKTQIPQVVFYQDGIGASPYLFAKLFEGATGSSLDRKVLEAYSFIVDNYQPGDQLYLFGFSRGAYTARTLASFINYLGIMTRLQRSNSLSTLWTAFRQRKANKPNTVYAAEQAVRDALGRWPSGNAMYSARLNMLGAAELSSGKETPDGAASKVRQEAEGAAARTPRVEPPTIEVVGVWDTVGALGVPGTFLSPTLVKYYSFFDPMLAPNVRHAFHAIALLEDRKDFLPTVWSVPRTEPEEDVRRRAGQQLRQVWFPGSHSDVGGGHGWHGLSDVTLAWMASQLIDRPNGAAPLLALDVQMLRSLADARLPWGRQPEHPSRLALEYATARRVQQWRASKTPNNSADDEALTYESIHHSVIVGQQYDIDSSEQFAFLRDTDAGRLMWQVASKEDTLGKTERLLRWTEAESRLAAQSRINGNANDVVPVADPELAPVRPRNVSAPLWHAVEWTCYAPLWALSAVVNFSTRGPSSQRNLEPPALLTLVQKRTKQPQQPLPPLVTRAAAAAAAAAAPTAAQEGQNT